MNILEEIVKYKKELLKRQKKDISQDRLLSLLDKPLPAAKFAEKIAQRGIHLIAEVKKASPSIGVIREDFDFLSIARAFAKGGASCLSVLTEDKFFQGSIAFLKKIKENVPLPLLRKDFVIDEYQIYESKVHGADAILLIASLLKDEAIRNFLKLARRINLDAVVEVHTHEELTEALSCGAKMIGINTRSLVDFSIDLKILPKLMAAIPSGCLTICESGIRDIEDLAFVKNLKPNAILVGEALMKARDTISKTQEFVNFLRGQ